MVKIPVETSRFGTIEVEESSIIEFVSPILGFDHVKKYVLLDHAENSPFKWLQAIDDPTLAFVTTNPKFFGIPYEFALPTEAAAQLQVAQAEDVVVLTIVNVPADNPAKMTANLLAPVVINQQNFKAAQVVLQDPALSTRTRLLPDPESETAAQSSTSAQGSGE